MNPLILISIVYAVALVATVAALLSLVVAQRRHYEALLRDVRADNLDLRGRLFASKNLPPPGVDMKAEHEQRCEERKTRDAEHERKSDPDPTWKMRRRLAEKEKRRLDGAK
jgi:hypothetical protein